MKFPNVKRYLSGILAAMLVLSSCGPTTTVYADEEDWPSLEEVIDQLDEDEIEPRYPGSLQGEHLSR